MRMLNKLLINLAHFQAIWILWLTGFADDMKITLNLESTLSLSIKFPVEQPTSYRTGRFEYQHPLLGMLNEQCYSQEANSKKGGRKGKSGARTVQDIQMRRAWSSLLFPQPRESSRTNRRDRDKPAIDKDLCRREKTVPHCPCVLCIPGR
jgi:hypothetical protein